MPTLSELKKLQGLEMPGLEEASGLGRMAPAPQLEAASDFSSQLAPTSPGLVSMTGRVLGGGLSAVGNILDVPGSMVRDTLALKNPLDQLIDPLGYRADETRTTGRELLRQYGAVGDEDTTGNWWGGFAAEVALDPLTYTGVGLLGDLTKAGQAAAKATSGVGKGSVNMLKEARRVAKDRATETARASVKTAGKEARLKRPMRGVGARTRVTPRMILEGQSDSKIRQELLESFYEGGGTEALLDQPLSYNLSFRLPFTRGVEYGTLSKQARNDILDRHAKELAERSQRRKAYREFKKTNPDPIARLRALEDVFRVPSFDKLSPAGIRAADEADQVFNDWVMRNFEEIEAAGKIQPGDAPVSDAQVGDLPPGAPPAGGASPSGGTPPAGGSPTGTSPQPTTGSGGPQTGSPSATPTGGGTQNYGLPDGFSYNKNIGQQPERTLDGVAKHRSAAWSARMNGDPLDPSDSFVTDRFLQHVVDPELAKRFTAHGTPDEKTLDNLIRNGVQEGQPFHTGPLYIPPENAGAMGGAGLGTKTNQPYLVVFDGAPSRSNAKIKTVIVNGDGAGERVEALREMYPGVEFLAPDEINGWLQKSTGGAEVTSGFMPKTRGTKDGPVVNYKATTEAFRGISPSHTTFDDRLQNLGLESPDRLTLQTLFADSNLRFIDSWKESGPLRGDQGSAIGRAFPNRGRIEIASRKSLKSRRMNEEELPLTTIHEILHLAFKDLQISNPEFSAQVDTLVRDAIADGSVQDYFRGVFGAERSATPVAGKAIDLAEYFSKDSGEVLAEMGMHVLSGRLADKMPEALRNGMQDKLLAVWTYIRDKFLKIMGAVPVDDPRHQTMQRVVEYMAGFTDEADELLAQMKALNSSKTPLQPSVRFTTEMGALETAKSLIQRHAERMDFDLDADLAKEAVTQASKVVKDGDKYKVEIDGGWFTRKLDSYEYQRKQAEKSLREAQGLQDPEAIAQAQSWIDGLDADKAAGKFDDPKFSIGKGDDFADEGDEFLDEDPFDLFGGKLPGSLGFGSELDELAGIRPGKLDDGLADDLGDPLGRGRRSDFDDDLDLDPLDAEFDPAFDGMEGIMDTVQEIPERGDAFDRQFKAWWISDDPAITRLNIEPRDGRGVEDPLSGFIRYEDETINAEIIYPDGESVVRNDFASEDGAREWIENNVRKFYADVDDDDLPLFSVGKQAPKWTQDGDTWTADDLTVTRDPEEGLYYSSYLMKNGLTAGSPFGFESLDEAKDWAQRRGVKPGRKPSAPMKGLAEYDAARNLGLDHNQSTFVAARLTGDERLASYLERRGHGVDQATIDSVAGDAPQFSIGKQGDDVDEIAINLLKEKSFLGFIEQLNAKELSRLVKDWLDGGGELIKKAGDFGVTPDEAGYYDEMIMAEPDPSLFRSKKGVIDWFSKYPAIPRKVIGDGTDTYPDSYMLLANKNVDAGSANIGDIVVDKDTGIAYISNGVVDEDGKEFIEAFSGDKIPIERATVVEPIGDPISRGAAEALANASRGSDFRPNEMLPEDFQQFSIGRQGDGADDLSLFDDEDILLFDDSDEGIELFSDTASTAAAATRAVQDGLGAESLLNSSRMTPQKIGSIDYAKHLDGVIKNPEVASRWTKDAGVSEGYTIGEHSTTVVRNLVRAAENVEPWKLKRIGSAIGDVGRFDEFLVKVAALHDIGKNDAIAAGGTHLQKKHTLPLLRSVLQGEGFDEQAIRFAEAVVSQDVFGEVLQGRVTPKQGAETLLEAIRSKELSFAKEAFLDMSKLLYEADASSYPYLKRRLFREDGSLRNASRLREMEGHLGHVVTDPYDIPDDWYKSMTGSSFKPVNAPGSNLTRIVRDMQGEYADNYATNKLKEVYREARSSDKTANYAFNTWQRSPVGGTGDFNRQMMSPEDRHITKAAGLQDVILNAPKTDRDLVAVRQFGEVDAASRAVAGETIEAKAITAASLDPDYAKAYTQGDPGAGYKAIIEIPKGSKMFAFNAEGSINLAQENEVMFGVGQKFKVISNDTENRTIVLRAVKTDIKPIPRADELKVGDVIGNKRVAAVEVIPNTSDEAAFIDSRSFAERYGDRYPGFDRAISIYTREKKDPSVWYPDKKMVVFEDIRDPNENVLFSIGKQGDNLPRASSAVAVTFEDLASRVINQEAAGVSDGPVPRETYRPAKGKPGVDFEPAYFLRKIDDEAEAVVARDEAGGPIGILHISKDSEGKIENLQVAVHPDHRRKGIGTSLFAKAKGKYPGIEDASGLGGYTEDGAKFTAGRRQKQADEAATAGATAKQADEARTEWLEKGTRSSFFKRWFGDWEADPASASKVVDAEGKPLVVYHGTGMADLGTEESVKFNRSLDEATRAADEWDANIKPAREKLLGEMKNARTEADAAGERIAEQFGLGRGTHSSPISGAITRTSEPLDFKTFLKSFKDMMEWAKGSRDGLQLLNDTPMDLIRKAHSEVAPLHERYKSLREGLDSLPNKPSVRGDDPRRARRKSESMQFDTLRYGVNDGGYLSAGTYFTKSPKLASDYAAFGFGSNKGVVPVYLNIRNPFIHGVTVDRRVDELANKIQSSLDMTTRAARGDVDEYSRNVATARRNALTELGYDGEIYDRSVAEAAGVPRKDLAESEIVAFYPEQIKSATGNTGAFDPTDADIRYSVGAVAEATSAKPSAASVAQRFTDFFSGWQASVPSNTASAVADFIDRGGDLFHKLPLASQLAALFRPEIFGGITEGGRELGRAREQAFQAAVDQYRSVIAPIVHDLHHSNLFNVDAMLAKDVTHESAIKALNANTSIFLELMEGVRPADMSGLADEWQTILPHVATIRTQLEETRKFVEASGFKLPPLDDLFAEYFPQRRANPTTNRNAKASINPKIGPVVLSQIDSQLAREFRDMPGGHAVLNDMSIDGNISGLRRRAKFVKKRVSQKEYAKDLFELEDGVMIRQTGEDIGPTTQLATADGGFITIREYVAQEYGKRLFKGYDAKKFDKESTQFDRWITYMMDLDEGYFREQLPLFGHNPISVMSRYLQDAYSLAYLGKFAQEYAGKAARFKKYSEGPSKLVQMDELFSQKDSFWNDNARENIIKSMDTSSQTEYQRALERNVASDYDRLINGGKPIHSTVDGSRMDMMFKEDPDGALTGFVTKKVNGEDKLVEVQGNIIEFHYETPRTADWSGVKKGEPELVETIIDNPEDFLRRTFTRGRTAKEFLSVFGVDAQVVDDINRFMKPFTLPDELRDIEHGLRRVTNVTKAGLTAMWPAFHLRNITSAMYMNATMGQVDPRFTGAKKWKAYAQPYFDTYNLLRGTGKIDDLDEIPDLLGKLSNRIKPEDLVKMTASQLDDELRKELQMEIFSMGVIGDLMGLAAEHIGDEVDNLISQFPGLNPDIIGRAPTGTRMRDALNPFATKDGLTVDLKNVEKDMFLGARIGRDVAGFSEAMNRISQYLAARRNGFSPQSARDLANKLHADYSALSAFESRVMRLVTPFYSFSRRITPVIVQDIASRPGGPTATIIKAANRSRDPNAVVPDHIADTVGFPLGETEDGSKRYLTGLGLPFEDTLNILDGPLRLDPALAGREFIGRSNPLIKAPLEWITGRSFFQDGPVGGRELTDLDPPIGRTLSNISDLATGERTREAEPFLGLPFEFAVANSPLSRAVSTARTATDPRKLESPAGVAALGANLLSGVRISDVSPVAQDAIYSERLGKAIKEMGGRTFARQYFSDEVEAKMTAEQRELAEQLLEELNVISKRFQDRRKQKEAEANKPVET